MTKNEYSQQYLRKRKMLLVMPLLVLPFLTLTFWALGGGKNDKDSKVAMTATQGLNAKLPDPNLKNEKGLTKMSYYEMAQTDSEKLKVRMRNDPFFTLQQTDTADEGSEETGDAYSSMAFDGGRAGKKEAEVYDRLKQINAALEDAKRSPQRQGVAAERSVGDSREPGRGNDDLLNYRTHLAEMPKPAKGVDSEMLQINAMLDKVMDIQHPERVSGRHLQNPTLHNREVFGVNRGSAVGEGFFTADGFGDNRLPGDSDELALNAVEAVVHETQSLVNGSYTKMRLLTDVFIRGILIPRDVFVYGKVTLTGERLEVAVNAIRWGQRILPVALSAYDMDGIAGIYIPGSINRDVAKQSTGNALQSVSLNSLDPSIGAQAMGAGIETAKTLINKKVKLVRVTVKAGYRVLLRNANVQ